MIAAILFSAAMLVCSAVVGYDGKAPATAAQVGYSTCSILGAILAHALKGSSHE